MSSCAASFDARRDVAPRRQHEDDQSFDHVDRILGNLRACLHREPARFEDAEAECGDADPQRLQVADERDGDRGESVARARVAC